MHRITPINCARNDRNTMQVIRTCASALDSERTDSLRRALRRPERALLLRLILIELGLIKLLLFSHNGG